MSEKKRDQSSQINPHLTHYNPDNVEPHLEQSPLRFFYTAIRTLDDVYSPHLQLLEKLREITDFTGVEVKLKSGQTEAFENYLDIMIESLRNAGVIWEVMAEYTKHHFDTNAARFVDEEDPE